MSPRMQQQVFSFLPKTAHAVLSDDRVYRYVLYRSVDGLDWDAELRPDGGYRQTVGFILINPSTADESASDPTIDKLQKYAVTWGFQRLAVCNLFAYRETESSRLPQLSLSTDLVGPDNDRYIRELTRDVHKIVCGWGNHGLLLDRQAQVQALLGETHHEEVFCFHQNQNGTPVHPLYQRDAAELVPFRARSGYRVSP